MFTKMLATIFLASMVLANQEQNQDKMLISNIDTLVLNTGEMTTGRRASPVPQMDCYRGCSNAPSTVTCENKGNGDNGDPIWECKADLPNKVHFTKMNVQCEGYDYPDDPYILKGSCGLSYSLSYSSSATKNYSSEGGDPSGLGGLILIVFIVLALSSCADPNPRYGSGASHPGFWTGAAAGAMGASAYNSRSSGWGGRSSGWSGRSSGFVRTTRR